MKTKATIKGLVLKVASRCNLNCEYCYMYNLGDKTYRLQPKLMSEAIVNDVLNNVRTYLTKSGSKTFTFIFHGGEPLLVGHDFYQNFVRKVKELLPAHIQIEYVVQTNGVLLTQDWCKVLGDLGIKIGISLDGLTEESNSYRLDHQGKSSLSATLNGIRNAQNSRYLKYLPGILSVINVKVNPEELYERYKLLKVRHINFLLPDGTHDNLPKGFDPTKTKYADWLICLFDIWFNDRDRDKPQITIFNQILHRILGGDSEFEYFGGGQDINLIIETNGDIEPQDSLKACGEGFTKTNLNIQHHALEDSFQQPLIQFCIESQQNLGEQCKQCSVVEICRGGFITHRYSAKNGFQNPSIYCADLEKVIRYIGMKVESILEESV
jgi:uncharacterized protein